MTNTTKIQFFQALQPKVGKHEAEIMVDYIDTSVKESSDSIYARVVTKEDLNKVELRIVEVKVEMVKWVFSVFVILMVAIVGLYFRK